MLRLSHPGGWVFARNMFDHEQAWRPELLEGVDYYENVSLGQFPSGSGVRAPQGFELPLEPDNFRSRPLARQLGASVFSESGCLAWCLVVPASTTHRPRRSSAPTRSWARLIPGENQRIIAVRSRTSTALRAAAGFDLAEVRELNAQRWPGCLGEVVSHANLPIGERCVHLGWWHAGAGTHERHAVWVPEKM